MQDAQAQKENDLAENTGDYKFIYANGFLFMGILALFFAAWFCAVSFAEWILFSVGINTDIAMPVIFIAGLPLGYFSLRDKFSKLYVREGEARISPDSFEIILAGKVRSIPFSRVRRMSYKQSRGERGMILSAKGHSLYIEEAKHYPKSMKGRPKDLWEFYQKLDAAVRLYKEENNPGTND